MSLPARPDSPGAHQGEAVEHSGAGAFEGSDPALVDDLADRIHGRILAGDFPVGSWLRQEALAATFGVSRTPVREALRKLQADRVVDLLPHRGALVRGPTAVDIRESYIIRGELEGLAAELAASHIDAEQLSRLRVAEDTFRLTLSTFAESVATSGLDGVANGPWDAANLAFHAAIVDAAGISRLSSLIIDLRNVFPRSFSWAALADEPTLLTENITQHARIRAAIERRDATAARRWAVDHCRRTGDLVATWFEQRYQVEPAEAETHAPLAVQG